MTLVSITRLRLRSIRYLFPFVLRAQASNRQATKTPGCRGVLTRKTRGLTFWTLSLWDDEKSMRAFLRGSPHREAMPKLAQWCDEASVGHWPQEAAHFPAWDAATRLMQEHGHLSRVLNPSKAHREGVMNVT